MLLGFLFFLGSTCQWNHGLDMQVDVILPRARVCARTLSRGYECCWVWSAMSSQLRHYSIIAADVKKICLPAENTVNDTFQVYHQELRHKTQHLFAKNIPNPSPHFILWHLRFVWCVFCFCIVALCTLLESSSHGTMAWRERCGGRAMTMRARHRIWWEWRSTRCVR